MRTAIYYFSGTGNSLYVAKQLKEHVDHSTLYPIVAYLKCEDITIKEEKLIVVFPIYALTIPIPVRLFLKKLNTDNINYISLVATRLGLYFDDFKRVGKLLKKKNAKIDSQFIINMPSNDIKVKDFKLLSPSELHEVNLQVEERIHLVSNTVNNSEKFLRKDENFTVKLPYGDLRDNLLLKIIPRLMTFSKWIGGVNYFYVTAECNGCSLCEKICLSTKISIKDSQPMWDKKKLCYMCYGCINFCPRHAIEIDSIPGVKSFSRDNPRYTNPNIQPKEIIFQKQGKIIE